MLESLRRRIPEHWKTKLAPLAEWLILAEPQLRLTDDMDGDAIRRKVAVYVKRCVRWQAKERKKQARLRASGNAPSWLSWGRQPVNRAAGVFIAGLIGLTILAALAGLGLMLVELKILDATSLTKWLEPNPVVATVLSLLVGSPVAFVIWRYRDQNTLWQIENQRKDINLKDFQKLAEWASGQHLQEDKVVEQTKRTEKATVNGPEVTTETVTTREGSAPPDHARSVNKRTGGESLQVAAVYQLQAFLNGDFGNHFKHPTFQLLKSLWSGLVDEKSKEIDQIFDNLPREQIDLATLDVVSRGAIEELETITRSPLGLALNQILTTNNNLLYENKNSLPHSQLSGINEDLQKSINFKLPNLDLRGIKLSGATLTDIHLQGAILIAGKFQKCTFLSARFDGANLDHAKIQGGVLNYASLIMASLRWASLEMASLNSSELVAANMQRARLQQASICYANLNFANLEKSNLQEASLSCSSLKWANLSDALLKDADLSGAILSNASLVSSRLMGANFSGANFCGADLSNARIDKETRALGAIYDEKTIFGTDEAAITTEKKWRDMGARRVDEQSNTETSS